MSRILALSAAAIMASGAAFAADLPLPPSPAAEPADVAPVPQEQQVSFNGPYAGLEGGGGFNNTESEMLFNATAATFFGPCFAVGCAPLSNEYEVDGAVAGGRLGFNLQAGSFVFGLEGDLNWSGMEGSYTATTTVPPFVPVTLSTESDYGYIGTARARAGITFGRVLVYGTGGLAFAEVEDSVVWGDTTGATQLFVGSEEGTLFGWTGGGGVDVALTNNIIVGVQGLYFDLEDQTVDLANIGAIPPPAGSAVSTEFDHTGFLVKGHVSFRFGGLGGM